MITELPQKLFDIKNQYLNVNYNHINPTECISFITFPLTAKPASLEALNIKDFLKGLVLYTCICFGEGEW